MKQLLPIFLLLCSTAATAQRLPDDAVPLHYQIRFVPDLQHASFTGEETIEVNILHPVSGITLNAEEIEFKSATVSSAGRSQSAEVSLDANRRMATLHLPNQLLAGPATIHIEFRGILNNQLRGFYLSKGRDRAYATTQFESTDARRAFPCFDEPAYKATFDLSFVVDKGDTVISNGRIVADIPGPEDGKHTVRFSTTPKMSSYLVAMAVGDWQCSEGEADGIPIRVCSTPDKKNLTPFALRSAEEILRFYNRYFQIRYPFGKLDILALPDFEAGAMENTGAIFYRETLLLIDDAKSSLDAHKAVAEVLAHEMAHQWFGDLVTMQWWDDIWLNEGFADWMESKPVAAWKPEWREDLVEVEGLGQALDADALRNTRAIRQRAETPEEINELFDDIAYAKSAAVLRMIEHYVGPEVFRRGVNAYLGAHAYGNARAEDFWSAIAAASGKPIDKLMPTFVDQPGEPLIGISSSCKAGVQNVTLSQQRFFANSSNFGSAPNQLWQVPICLRLGDQPSQCQMLSERKKTLPYGSCSQPVFANTGASGYYHTLYSDEDLARIRIPQLEASERLLLLRDEWAAVQAGQTSIANWLQLLPRLKEEREPMVLDEIFGVLGSMEERLVTEGDRHKLRELILGFARPLAEEIGFEDKPGEDDNRRELRASLLYLLGHAAGDPRAVAVAKELVERYLRQRDSVDPTLIQPALQIAAEKGDAALYDKFLAAANSARTPEEYHNFLRALDNFEKPELIVRTLELAVSPQIRNQDASGLIARELNPRNQGTGWPWIRSHWSDVERQITMSSGETIVGATRNFCDAPHREEVQKFFQEHRVPSAERVLRQTIERINTCIDLRKQQQQNLSRFLEKSAAGASSAGGK